MFKLKVKFLSFVLAVLLSVVVGAAPSFAQPADIQGHWAEKQIGDWVAKGLASGYPDGSFRPDNSITRAEFITLVNKSFGFTVQTRIYFNDVSSTDWFYNEIAKAGAAGYISGYEDGSMKPGNEISRQEVAVILAKLLKLETGADVLGKFTDAGSFPRWSGGAVSAVVAGGYMAGYPDMTFQPAKSITRAEAVATLDRAKGAPPESGAVGKAFDKAGIYGPESGMETIAGDVTISAAGVTLRNSTVNGNLVLTEGVGEGDVHLENVTVKGSSTIKGGGENSVILEDCTLGAVSVNKKNGKLRVKAAGKTSVKEIKLESGVILEESGLTGDGFTRVTITGKAPAGAVITLKGDFDSVDVAAPGITVRLAGGTAAAVTVAEEAEGTTVEVNEEARITTLTLNAAVKVTGRGAVEKALFNADGVSMEQKPGSYELADGVTATIADEEVRESTPGAPGGGGGGGGGATSPVDEAPVVESVTFVVDGKQDTVYGENNNFHINLTNYGYTDDSTFDSITVNASSDAAKASLLGKTINFNQGKAHVNINKTLGDLKKYLSILGNEISITVTDKTGHKSEVTVTITL